ncbi:MAG: 2-oxoacid:acceptor oxidoreductase family protein [Deltaproteobacteria bacterium]|nr:2-oxoacid:acceptor oxidoreductase family protein [Deltaproteobacteria bacterium]MBW1925374.1 2-oxoacid:acceptor oxidoreductase family protein [Deltaproteobacteria bacterium]MBW1950935.1 2-oxoacid:acceptor oxidoreductase family protein [Deltaproteobacteria bacterium]MBW2008989.1 2-oxoacid:acceptor oxidoreductase family protein [Deltaproteobacteria bacterium]MBW2104031.1 2-oxoacid:acceptor oxidoreductase family protein [Deltaproteobacteria bacterium]
MITRTIFAGFGGQGVLLMGYVLSHGALHKGLNVTYFPSYGAEMRGGTANCTVTLSDKKIASPVASRPDVVVAMNGPSLEKFEPTVVENGLVFLNASLINEKPGRSDLQVIPVPVVELAQEAGSARGGNMVMIGAVCAKTGMLSLDETVEGMKAALKGKAKFFDQNRKAIERGFTFIEEGK